MTLCLPGPSAIRMNDIRLNLIAMTTMLLAAGALAGSAQKESTVQTMVFDRAIQPGEVVRLDVTCNCDARGATATVFGQDMPLFPIRDANAWRGLIGIDLDVRPGTYSISIAVDHVEQGPIATTRELTVVTKRFPTRRLRVPAGFVNPPGDAIERIKHESLALQAVFETVTMLRQWQRAFQAPVRARANSSFGTRSVFNGQATSAHSGADFRAKAGTPVAAPAAGVVRIAEPLFFTGHTIVIDHGLGLYSLLAHLSNFNVKVDDRVRRGHIVGFVGATGRVTGPHLHWSVRLNGARVDPLSLMAVTKSAFQNP